MLAGDRVWVGGGYATCLPTLDWETYSEAGFIWDPALVRWQSPPGLAQQNRGLGAVGARNYVMHPTFEPLSLSFDLFDLYGLVKWVPGEAWPMALLSYVHNGGMLESWNANFEWTVWNLYCVPRWGWPKLPIEQMVCAMAKARAWGFPGKLENAGEVWRTRRAAQTREEIAASMIPRPPIEDDDIPF